MLKISVLHFDIKVEKNVNKCYNIKWWEDWKKIKNY